MSRQHDHGEDPTTKPEHDHYVALAPGWGWWAIYWRMAAPGGLFGRPLVGWGLRCDGVIVPLATRSDGVPTNPMRYPNFVGIRHVADPDDLGSEKWLRLARDARAAYVDEVRARKAAAWFEELMAS